MSERMPTAAEMVADYLNRSPEPHRQAFKIKRIDEQECLMVWDPAVFSSIHDSIHYIMRCNKYYLSGVGVDGPHEIYLTWRRHPEQNRP